ncbi:hypothetical protein QUB24_32655, partial [Microcoleus sp. B9-D4]
KLHHQIFLTGLRTAVIVPHLFEKGYSTALPFSTNRLVLIFPHLNFYICQIKREILLLRSA